MFLPSCICHSNNSEKNKHSMLLIQKFGKLKFNIIFPYTINKEHILCTKFTRIRYQIIFK